MLCIPNAGRRGGGRDDLRDGAGLRAAAPGGQAHRDAHPPADHRSRMEEVRMGKNFIVLKIN